MARQVTVHLPHPLLPGYLPLATLLKCSATACSTTACRNRSPVAFVSCTPKSGRKKEPKPKLFGPDIFQWGRGLPRERVVAKKFDKSLEAREIKLFGWDIPGFCRDSLRKKVWVQFSFPTKGSYDNNRERKRT